MATGNPAPSAGQSIKTGRYRHRTAMVGILPRKIDQGDSGSFKAGDRNELAEAPKLPTLKPII